jgi:hypothetical protein
VFTGAFSGIIDSIQGAAGDREWLIQNAVDQYKRDPTFLRKQLFQALQKKLGRPLYPAEIMAASSLIDSNLRVFLEQLTDEQIAAIQTVFKDVKQSVRGISRDGHKVIPPFSAGHRSRA